MSAPLIEAYSLSLADMLERCVRGSELCRVDEIPPYFDCLWHYDWAGPGGLSPKEFRIELVLKTGRNDLQPNYLYVTDVRNEWGGDDQLLRVVSAGWFSDTDCGYYRFIGE